MERQPSNQPIDEEVQSVPLDTSEGEVVIAQENAGGRDNIGGSGEWPDPKSPPRGPAPGTVDEDREAIERKRHREASSDTPSARG